VAKRKPPINAPRHFKSVDPRERLEGCFIFTRDEWIVIASSLDRLVTGRNVPVKVKAKHIAAKLVKQIRQWVLVEGGEGEHG